MKSHLVLALLGVAIFCQRQTYADNSTSMPLSYFRNSGLEQAMSSDDAFVNHFMDDYDQEWNRDTNTYKLNTETEPLIDVIGSTNLDDVERSELAATVKHAGCDLYDQVVTIPNDKANVLMYPSCVQLKQCGGCCGHPSLACKPTSTKTKSVQIMKYVYDGTSAHPVQKVDYVQLQEHTACECQCKTTAEDCNKVLHTFDSWNCKCTCKNSEEQCATNKRWDENICACRCASVQTCGSGYDFNMESCTCQEISERSGGNAIPDNQPTNEVAPPAETDECATHMSCPRRYVAKSGHGGVCYCEFDATAARGGRRR